MKIARQLLFLFTCILLALPVYAETGSVKSADGVNISYLVEGSGEPAIVFIHGWCCDKTYWDEQINAFSPKYTVVAIDLAGHGESGTERKDYTMEAFGQDAAAVVNHLKLDKIILVGHSMGGDVIYQAAKLLKPRVIGLIGADTFQDIGGTINEDQLQQFLRPLRENFKQTATAFVKQMFAADADTNLVNKVAEDMSSAPQQVALSAMENLFRDHGEKLVEGVSNIKLISINSDKYPTNIADNKKLVPLFEVKIIKGSGHFVMLEKPAEFDKDLQEAINEITQN